MDELKGKKILMFVDKIFEDLELLYPQIRMKEAGAEVIVAGPIAGETYIGKNGYPLVSDASFEDMNESDFNGLIIPGGFAPDKLRRYDKVKELTRQFHESGKLVAYICHAGWVPISAGIVKGKKCTSTTAIIDDLKNAGAEWVDEPVVVDGNHISSRTPVDLPDFCKAIINFLK